MVIGDYFSRWKEAFALPNHTALTVADKLTTEFICRFGTPTRIHTDQGREFESVLFAEICKLLGVEKSRTTPYHPQSDGMVERYNQTAQIMLAMYVDENRSNWDDHLPYVMMAYRAAIHESTKCTPNKLMLGREISLPIDVMAGAPPKSTGTECPVQYVEWVKDALQRAYEFAHENMQSSFQTNKRYYDVKLKTRTFEINQLVWCWYPPQANIKLGLGWTGPYNVTRRLSDITYQITSCATGKSKIVHVNHLKPVVGDGYINQLTTVDITGQDYTETESGDVTVHFDNEVETLLNKTETNESIEATSVVSPKPQYTTRGRLIKPRIPYTP
ncbi:unnamed protein product [Mytilus edulis]|uniref:Integrase catalytic domain-containing protein n=1 Tax=Mytilus edulis TaxID=6550 RepID=A0A8S3S2V6_MYTED|nr:unnamed protein product [Mytilus edulis]